MAGGFDINGETIYVGRAKHSGDLIPGKIVVSHGCCYISHDGREHAKPVYEALVARGNIELVWAKKTDTTLPGGAVQGGETAGGEPLYIGRHEHAGSDVVGNIHPSHKRCYIAFGGDEHSYDRYETLCIKSISF